jgi:predicted nucleic acid-binding protein
LIDAILDTGALVGSLDSDDQWHGWSATQFALIRQPALTCDAVISEACFLLREVPGARQKIFTLIERGILRIVPVLPEESPFVRVLLTRYGKRMDYADACLVRMSELNPAHTVVTTDTADLKIYRRFTRQVIPLIVP